MIRVCKECDASFQGSNRTRYCEQCRSDKRKLCNRQSAAREDPAIRRARQRRHAEQHRERIAEQHRKHRATQRYRDYKDRFHDQERFGGLRHLVLERDGYKCQLCGVVRQPGKRNIIVHHKDHNPLNNQMDNLITLCRKCHPRKHTPTPEINAKRSAALTGRKRGKGKPLTLEHRLKIGAALKGQPLAPSTKQQISEKKRQWWALKTEEERKLICEQISRGRLKNRS